MVTETAARSISGVEYTKIGEIRGPLMVVQGVSRVAYDELVEIETASGEKRLGRVLEVGEGNAVVQVFEGTQGLAIQGTRARFLGRTMELAVSMDMLGRVFDGLGRPLDGLPEPVAEEFRDVNGAPINPEARDYPTDFIQTGVSVIDGMNSLVRGQKLPIFSGAGLPHNTLAAQIARQSTIPGKAEEFAVVFAAIGAQNDEARYFKTSLEETGAIKRSVLYLNLADDPAIERVITPRIALTAAEYLAFTQGLHILVILSDLTNYCFSGDTEIILGDGSIKKIGQYVEKMVPSPEQAHGAYVPIPTRSGTILLGQLAMRSGGNKASALTWDGSRTLPGKILAVQKIVAPKQLIEIKTRSGASLKVTADHKLLVDTPEGPALLPAGKAKPGDELYSVKKFDIEAKTPSILELFQDEESEKFYVQMKNDQLEQLIAQKYGTLKKASQELGLDYIHISDSYRKRTFHPHELAEIAGILNMSPREVSQKIRSMTAGGIETITIPEAQVTEELVQILGWVLSDGTIYENEKQGTYYVNFSNKNRKLIELFTEKITKLFPGTNPQIHQNQDGVWITRINNKVIAHIAEKLTRINTEDELTPIFKLPEKHIAKFLSAYFDGDGSAPADKQTIQITTASMTRAKRIQQLLKRLGIPSAIIDRGPKGTYGHSNVHDVVIRGKQNVLQFIQQVGASHPEKEARLEELAEKLRLQKHDRADHFDLAPRICGTLLQTLRTEHGVKATNLGTISTISEFEHGTRRAARKLLRKWLNKLAHKVDQNTPEYKKLVELTEGNYVLDKITKVKTTPNQEPHVYDLTISQTHKIITQNGIITSNCEALREISAAREEVPGRKGYPGYLYTDLATNYERAGRIKNQKGSITQMPILSMPSDDITHPIPDLSGYICEGQIVLGRDLYRKGIYPPVNVLMSLSRLMGPGIIAPKKTRADHGDVSNQLYAGYSRAVTLRSLAEIVGKSGLSDVDLKYIEFGDLFEQRFLRQAYDENRSIDQTIDLAWEIFSTLPESELTKIKQEFISKYYRGKSS